MAATSSANSNSGHNKTTTICHVSQQTRKQSLKWQRGISILFFCCHMPRRCSCEYAIDKRRVHVWQGIQYILPYSTAYLLVCICICIFSPFSALQETLKTSAASNLCAAEMATFSFSRCWQEPKRRWERPREIERERTSRKWSCSKHVTCRVWLCSGKGDLKVTTRVDSTRFRFLFRLCPQLIAHLARPLHVQFNQLKSHKIIESNRIKAKRNEWKCNWRAKRIAP